MFAKKEKLYPACVFKAQVKSWETSYSFNDFNRRKMSLSCIKKTIGIPENLDSGRMVWTLGLWTPGRLDFGNWKLGLWQLEAWTLRLGTLGLWITVHLDCERLDFEHLDPKKIYSFLVTSMFYLLLLLLFTVERLSILNDIWLICYGSVEIAMSSSYNLNLLQLIF